MYIREINKLNNEIAKDSRKGVNRLCYEKLRESTQKSIVHSLKKGEGEGKICATVFGVGQSEWVGKRCLKVRKIRSNVTLFQLGCHLWVPQAKQNRLEESSTRIHFTFIIFKQGGLHNSYIILLFDFYSVFWFPSIVFFLLLQMKLETRL